MSNADYPSGDTCSVYGCAFISFGSLPLMFIVFLGVRFGYWVWAVAITLSCIVVYSIRLGSRREAAAIEIQRTNKLKEPCEHGVEGASADYRLCPTCKKATEHHDFAIFNYRQDYANRLALEKQQRYEVWRTNIRMPEYLQAMHPREFEELVCKLYTELGYKAELTPYTGDGGIDGFLRRNGDLYLMQCKRVKGSVGEPVLRDLFGTITARRATGGIVVTTGSVSQKARSWARGKPIEIVELDQLTQLIRSTFDERTIVPDSFEPPKESKRLCPECGRVLRTINGKHGEFIGCSGYPDCRFTKKIQRGRSR